ncbi:branched-chain amino acid ABC transporter permease [Anaerobium acetethylicum]|uniref:Branched-chain amino acid transport system permease protein n=1 Tax=Anaerobium acetethylicum TaxID=1619234 RepID=A0A1D3TYP4_9FIRM|nr:branched-chain amino acid ABC transporter permease [Anaerobium acetethylicum]SCP99594.1 branched-chain amino acid transport system permease protein [Anaerobium acetethylicum]
MSDKYKKILMVLIPLMIAIAMPLIVTDNYFRGIFIMTLIYIIVVLGLNFITGLTGQMNLGTAGIFAMGSYTTALLSTKLGISPWLTIIGSIIMGLIIGVGLGYPSLRVQGVYLALTTIGFGEIVRILISNFKFTNGIMGIRDIPAFTIGSFSFDDKLARYYLYLVFVVIMGVVAYRITNSKWGRLFKAIRDNYEAVQAVGVDIAKPKVLAFTLAAIYGCVAGSLYAVHMEFITPSVYTFDLSTTFIVMMMLGGIGSVPGCILGAVVCTILPELLRDFGNWYWIIFSILVLLVILFRPNGIISFLKTRKKSVKEGVK